MTFRYLAKGARARPVIFARGYFAFFRLYKFRNLTLHRTESEFSIKPERARFDSLFVLVPDLIRVNRDDFGLEHLAEKRKRARVSPSRFAVAECVVEIETELHALKKREAFGVAQGDA